MRCIMRRRYVTRYVIRYVLHYARGHYARRYVVHYVLPLCRGVRIMVHYVNLAHNALHNVLPNLIVCSLCDTLLYAI